MTLDAGGGDSRLRGNDGRRAAGNGGTQRRKDAMKSRQGIPAYAGMTGGGVGMAGWGRDMTWRNVWE